MLTYRQNITYKTTNNGLTSDIIQPIRKDNKIRLDSGRQGSTWLYWIHRAELCEMYCFMPKGQNSKTIDNETGNVVANTQMALTNGKTLTAGKEIDILTPKWKLIAETIAIYKSCQYHRD